jgi:hypothetical protein
MEYVNSFISTYLPKHKNKEIEKQHDGGFINDLEKMLNELSSDDKADKINKVVKNPDFLKKFIKEFQDNYLHLSQANLSTLINSITLDQVLNYIILNEYDKATDLYINVSIFIYAGIC